MAVRLSLVGALCVLGAVACTSVQTSTNFDPSAVSQLDTYRTYSWLPMKKEGTDPRIYNPIIQSRVHQSVEEELARRGFRQAAPGQKPDFKLGWHGALDKKVAVDTIDNYYGYVWDPWYDPFFGPVGYGGSGLPVTQTVVREYNEGTLILDVVDADSNKLVWRGTAQAQLSDRVGARKSQKLIDKAVGELLEDFPPEPKK